MCDKNIKVDERGKILLNELFSVINQKAEKVIKTPEDIEKKKIDKKYLTKLFETNETYAIKEDILSAFPIMIFSDISILPSSLIDNSFFVSGVIVNN